MILTKENLNVLESDYERNIVTQLLEEIKNDINPYLNSEDAFHISYVLEHTECSPESTDPCPDYYHTYSIVSNAIDFPVSDGLNIRELDETVCAIDLSLEISRKRYDLIRKIGF